MAEDTVNRCDELAGEYLTRLLKREKRQAIKLIVDSAESGMPIDRIYLYILQPVLREIGRLWQHNEVTVAQEHYCSAVTQLAMSQLYPYIFTQNRDGHRMVMTCIEGERALGDS